MADTCYDHSFTDVTEAEKYTLLQYCGLGEETFLVGIKCRSCRS